MAGFSLPVGRRRLQLRHFTRAATFPIRGMMVFKCVSR